MTIPNVFNFMEYFTDNQQTSGYCLFTHAMSGTFIQTSGLCQNVAFGEPTVTQCGPSSETERVDFISNLIGKFGELFSEIHLHLDR